MPKYHAVYSYIALLALRDKDYLNLLHLIDQSCVQTIYGVGLENLPLPQGNLIPHFVIVFLELTTLVFY